ncbi:hypothetical protein GGR28_003498 [Lewinella aquimaris]|uniref:DUF4256 domain-containing protein n=1 Tax=Neolewinella aquimaris TaxID=1835722 RepID=A0A840EGC1_9BACT|nr:DUF4256 domain-containing protein [Neolewinella aquimaris]MBB4080859.1 hypothetical protein [Neolewinella aquimaris]
MATNFQLSSDEKAALLSSLEQRFGENLSRHEELQWSEVRDRLEANPKKLWSLHEMEQTGGEPDVVGRDTETGEYIFCDCAAESPVGRRSCCYDRAALESRRANPPDTTAVDLATAMGIELLTEDQYRELQQHGPFDTKTSSWLKTPDAVRKLGGALFGDHRFGREFVYHNGAQSYYAARGFRGMLRV